MKKLLVGLLLFSLLAGACLAQGPHVFMGIYWVRGQLVRGSGVPDTVLLSGRTAILYPSTGDPLLRNTRVETTTASDGKFILNPFYNENLPITLEANYFASAVLRAADGYGADAVTFGLSSLGYNDVTLTLASGAGPGTIDLNDTGWIRETTIRRDGNALVLNWGYDPAKGATAVKIYVSSGPDTEFVAERRRFSDLTSIASGVTTYRHTGAASDTNNYYYRIVPDPLPSGTTILSADNNSITVGKVMVAVPANKYVFTALPFQEDNISLAGIVAEQLGEGGEFLWWDGIGYHGATYAGRRWVGEDRNLRIGEGFIVRSKTEVNLALVGRFGTLATPYTRTLPASRYSLIAYPYPTARTLSAMGVTASNGDDLLRWKVADQVYEGATYSGGWVGPAGIDNFELARPRYYRSGTEKSWTIAFP